MRRCHSLAMTLPLVMGMLLVAPSAVIACTCDVSVRTRAEERKNIADTLQISHAVFLGEVVAVDQFKAVVKVKRVWKGDLGSEVTMSTGRYESGDGTTGIATEIDLCVENSWEVGEQYVVFAIRHLGGNPLRANKCGPTTNMPSGQATATVLDEIAPVEKRDKRLF